MKEFLQSIFKSTEERIKNPFIGAFMTSWVLLNWKAIIFLVYSSKSIEDKIKYIEMSFSDNYYVFWLPLLSGVFYVLILPYLNLLFDELLKFPQLKRNSILINKQLQTIENQKQLAIEEIKLEEAKIDFRERNSHNKLVEDLQIKIKELELNAENEKIRNIELVNQLRAELVSRDKLSSNELQKFEKRYGEFRNEIILLNDKIFEKDEQIQDLNSKLNSKNLKIKLENSRILHFENGLKIVESYDNNKKLYRNLDTNENYDEIDVEMLKKKYNYK